MYKILVDRTSSFWHNFPSFMEPYEIKALRDQWEAEVQAFLEQRRQIDSKILGLKTMIKGLDYMAAVPPETPQKDWKLEPLPLPAGLEKLHSSGPTEAIRLILSDSVESLTARQIRDRLLAYGYDKLPDENPMAAVHGVLRRLVVTGDVVDSEGAGGKTSYRILSDLDKLLNATTNSTGVMGVFSGKRGKTFDERIQEGNKALERSNKMTEKITRKLEEK